MLQHIDLQNVLVLDIETVSNNPSFESLPPLMQQLWTLKSIQIQQRKSEDAKQTPAESYTTSAGIYAEFGKIVCISVGLFTKTGHLKLKSFYGHDECKLLKEFGQMLEQYFRDNRYICGHNIREFDIPYICRRLLLHQLPLPRCLTIAGKKPWELTYFLDTLTLWKFGDYKHYTSLKLLCGLFDIPTPKEDIDGSQVGPAYWIKNDLKRIKSYCKKDVVATARLLMRYQCRPIVEDNQIIYTN
jgi:hypothetical protein